jgi:single-stranded DNA-specific DHH superfamily exonuclease
MKHLVIGHADFDGMASIINVYNTIKDPENDFEYMVTGYNSIDKIISKLSKENYEILWILDINLTLEQLHDLKEYHSGSQIIWIDHHSYEYDVQKAILDLNLKCKFIHDHTISACLATNNFFVMPFTKAHMKCRKLSVLGDIYDMWRREDPRFLQAHAINDLYWEFKYAKFFSKFKDGYHLDDECKETITRIQMERKAYVSETMEKYYVHNHEADIVYIFNPACDHTNYFTLVIDAKFYVILKGVTEKQLSYSIRVYDPEFNLTLQDVFAMIKEKGINVITSGGHPKVGGITVTVDDNEKFLSTINDIFEKGTE